MNAFGNWWSTNHLRLTTGEEWRGDFGFYRELSGFAPDPRDPREKEAQRDEATACETQQCNAAEARYEGRSSEAKHSAARGDESDGRDRGNSCASPATSASSRRCDRREPRTAT